MVRTPTSVLSQRRFRTVEIFMLTKVIICAIVGDRIELRTSEAGLEVDAAGEEQGCITYR